jgi:hypothetical protein
MLGDHVREELDVTRGFQAFDTELRNHLLVQEQQLGE